MNNAMFFALNARLESLRDLLEKAKTVGMDRSLLHQYADEANAISNMLVGDDPEIWASIAWLRDHYKDSDLVLRDTDGNPLADVSGNESWVLVDIHIGDDYGAQDFKAEYAIWRNTACVYRSRRGAVEDDPIYDPKGVFNRD